MCCETMAAKPKTGLLKKHECFSGDDFHLIYNNLAMIVNLKQ